MSEEVAPVSEEVSKEASEKNAKAHKEKKTKREIPPNRPVKPLSSFNVFRRSFKEEDIEKETDKDNSSKRNTFFSKKWKALTEEERNKWTEQYNELNKKYKEDLEKWYNDNPGQKELEQAEAAAKKQKKKDGKDDGKDDGDADAKPEGDTERDSISHKEEQTQKTEEQSIVYPQGPLIIFIMAHYWKFNEDFGRSPPYSKNLANVMYEKWHGLEDERRGIWTKLFTKLNNDVKKEIIDQYERWEHHVKPTGK